MPRTSTVTTQLGPTRGTSLASHPGSRPARAHARCVARVRVPSLTRDEVAMDAAIRHARAFARMTTTRLGAAVVAAAAALVGCSVPVASVGSGRIQSPPASAIRGPYAPAGQRVTVRLV